MAKKETETKAAPKKRSISKFIESELGIEKPERDEVIGQYHSKKGIITIRYSNLVSLLGKWSK